MVASCTWKLSVCVPVDITVTLALCQGVTYPAAAPPLPTSAAMSVYHTDVSRGWPMLTSAPGLYRLTRAQSL